MTIPMMALTTGLSLVFLVAIFRPLELAFPARPGQRFFRPAFFTDLCFLIGQYLLWSGLVFWLLVHFASWIDTAMPSGFRASVAAQPWWLQAIEVVLLSDLCVYWGHRLQHKLPLLWRFHSIHHSSEHLDWLATYREHPIDMAFRVALVNLPIFILGFPLQTLAALIVFRDIWALYLHSNVRLPIGPLRMLIGAPELHHWHHDRDREAGNYANISPLMDLIFGTYRCPDHEPERLGIDEPIAKGYLGQMLHPFRIRRGPKSEHEAAEKTIESSWRPANAE
jgi:sterol desaturase/sphingolipid hydroxylase (fatty acid hydroxylase superfamily)